MELLDALYDYIVKYTNIDDDKVYRGWQNRMALPTTNEYIVYYVKDTERHGTNVVRWRGEAEKIDNYVLREYTVAIDVYDTSHERALQRIQDIETMARSQDAIVFLREQGYYLQYANDFRLIPFTDSNNQYIYRYNIEIHVSNWNNTEINQDFATEVKVEKFISYVDPSSGETKRRNVIVNADEYLR